MATKETEQKDGLALIVGGIFVLALVFAGYNYFNKGSVLDNENSRFKVERNRDNDDEGEVMGDLNGDGASTSMDNEMDDTSTANRNSVKENASEALNYFYTQWTANDYEEGDIQGDTYEVTEGDTLWEIAEGAYGNGAEWTRILEANSNDVGYLPSGQQALIVPGQTLVLP